MLSSADRFDIHQLVQFYGHLIDEREYSRIDELFTDDITYDARQRGAGIHHGLQAVRDLWEAFPSHPIAHHATNVMIDPLSADHANVINKGILVHVDGTVHSNVYRNIAVRTDKGWRISHLVMSKRTEDTIPEIS